MIKNFGKTILLFFCIVIFAMTAACDDSPGDNPENPYTRENPVTLPEQKFENAFEAYSFGKQFFENAKNYETTYYGTATPQGGLSSLAGVQQINTRSFLSDNGDFLYDSANYSSGSIDVSFSFIAAIQDNKNDVYYKKTSGKNGITKADSDLYTDYSSLSLTAMTSVSMDEFKNTCGYNPKELFNYTVNMDTISNTDYFTKIEEDDVAYAFKFSMKKEAHGEGYQKQIKYSSGYNYSSDGFILSLEFKMDKYGRILQINTVEEYSVSVPILGKQKTKLDAVQYITYSRNPLINFDGFTVSYEEAA